MIRLITLISAFLLPVTAHAGELSVTPENTPIAKPVTARIEVKLPPGEKAIFPETIALPGGAEPVSAKINQPLQAPDGVVHSAEYVFEMYKVGPAEILEIEYTVISADGGQRRETAGPAPFEVVSVRTDPETAETLKDILPPVTTELRPSKYILPGLIVLAAIAAAALLFYWWRKRRKKPSVPPPPPLPAHEVAFSELDALKAEGLCARGAYQEHFYRLSEIMRRYVENRYFIPALESTTLELRRRFDETFEDDKTRAPLFRLLEACDLVKFAKAAPTPANAGESVRRAREWVEATRPREREEVTA